MTIYVSCSGRIIGGILCHSQPASGNNDLCSTQNLQPQRNCNKQNNDPGITTFYSPRLVNILHGDKDFSGVIKGRDLRTLRWKSCSHLLSWAQSKYVSPQMEEDNPMCPLLTLKKEKWTTYKAIWKEASKARKNLVLYPAVKSDLIS